jgi:hypothetical protein
LWKSAFAVAIGAKADIAFCTAYVRFITELKLLSPEERGNQNVLTARFDGIVARICHTTITLPEAIKLAATCGAAAEFKNAITVDVGPAITDMIGSAGLGKKETGRVGAPLLLRRCLFRIQYRFQVGLVGRSRRNMDLERRAIRIQNRNRN